MENPYCSCKLTRVRPRLPDRLRRGELRGGHRRVCELPLPKRCAVPRFQVRGGRPLLDLLPSSNCCPEFAALDHPGGVCSESPAALDAYQCACTRGYSGVACGFREECVFAPCRNGAACVQDCGVDAAGGVQRCPDGWRGNSDGSLCIEAQVRDPTTWTTLQYDGPNQLGLW